VVLLDRSSWRVANVVLRLRVARGHLSSTEVRRLLRDGVRSAGLYVGGGHFGGAVMTEVVRRRSPWLARRVRLFSVLRPLPELVAELNDFRPTMLSGYPTAMALLASEQAAGRLAIRPVLAAAAGEVVTPATRAAVEEQLGCRLLETYAASEAPPMALGCRAGWLHVNADWFLLEPVDADHRPVPPGVLSHTVLVTNLGNRVQPVIRYDLGDRVVERPDPCPCGNPLPAIRVEGRTNDVLALPGSSGTTVPVLPLALGTVVEDTAGVRRFQLVQTGPSLLTLHVEPLPGTSVEDVRARIEHRLREYLAGQGVTSLVVEHSSEPPRPDPRSGKLRQVFSRL
jgi:phenylacetate-coenzyme A ligase PaaK-like adenylate-forming protein